MFDNFLVLLNLVKDNAFFVAFIIPNYYFIDSIMYNIASNNLEFLMMEDTTIINQSRYVVNPNIITNPPIVESILIQDNVAVIDSSLEKAIKSVDIVTDTLNNNNIIINSETNSKNEIKMIFIEKYNSLLNLNDFNLMVMCQGYFDDEVFFNCIKNWLQPYKSDNFEFYLLKMNNSLKYKWKLDFAKIVNCNSIDDFKKLNIDPYRIVHVIKNIKNWEQAA